jgi:hypothetical protein
VTTDHGDGSLPREIQRSDERGSGPTRAGRVLGREATCHALYDDVDWEVIA